MLRRSTVVCWFIVAACFASAGTAAGQASPAEQEFLFAYKLMQRGDAAEAGAAFDAFLEKF
ncbi:MAG: hypothetical protein AAFX76_11175, partial [Planctomycetota bacterium]